jgi:hypothetical protein
MFKKVPLLTLSALVLSLFASAFFAQSANATERDFIHFERMRARFEEMQRPEVERKPSQEEPRQNKQDAQTESEVLCRKC